jgi:hypothetical protein
MAHLAKSVNAYGEVFMQIDSRMTSASLKTIRAGLKDKTLTLGFHGSNDYIQDFTTDKIGLGGDGNSSLGLFTTEIPEKAAEYAEIAREQVDQDESYVHVLIIPTRKTYEVADFAEMFEPEGVTDRKAHFAALRESLILQGYDSASYEDGEDVMMISLLPEQVQILGVLTEDECYELDEDCSCRCDGVKMLKLLMNGMPLVAKAWSAHDEDSLSR